MDNFFERKDSFKVYLELAVPMLVANMVSMVYNIADTYFISYAQDAALVAGVSLCGPVLTILMALGNLVAQGGSSLTSRLIGEKNDDALKKVYAYCFYMGILFGVAAAVIGLILRTPILYMLGADAETFASASDYYTVIMVGAPLVVLTFVPSNLLRAEGMAKQAMYASLLGTVINLILDPLFILVFHWSAFGAALATIIGNAGNVLLISVIALAKSHYFSLNVRSAVAGNAFAKEIYSIGISSAIMNLLMSISQTFYNQSLLVYGNDKIAAMGIAAKIYNVPFMCMLAFAFGAQPLIGYFYGSKQWKRLYKFLHQWGCFQLGFAALSTVLLMSLAGVLVPCFLKDPDIVKNGIQILDWQSSTAVLAAVGMFTSILFQAIGKAKFSFIMSVSRQGVFLILMLYLLPKIFGYTGVIAAQAAGNVLSAALSLVLLAYIWRRRPKE